MEVNDEYIFRFPKRPDVEPQYAMEALLLAELVTRLPIAVPSFQFVWAGRAEYMRFVGYRKLAGVPLACDRHTSPQLAQLAEQLATFLSKLHRFPVDLATQRLVPGGDPAQWRQHYQQFYERVREQVFPLLDAPRTRAKAALHWEEFLNNEAHFRFAPALIHHDLNSEHILCDPVGATISGIIDWGDAAIGDPADRFRRPAARLRRRLHRAGAGRLPGRGGCNLPATDAPLYDHAIPFHEILFGITIEDEGHIRQGVEALRVVLSR